jgi:cyclase
MNNVRIIARLDVKGPNLVKGVQFEGLRKLGAPNDFARNYYKQGIDELVYIDIVASLYQRNNLLEIVEEATQDIFVPITVGGGLRSEYDVERVLRAGADKAAINTAAIRNPDLISQVSRRFGSQCMVLSIQAKRQDGGTWEAYVDNGRERTSRDAIAWAREGFERGAGEILLTSVDREGTEKGFDTDLVRRVAEIVPIPVIAGGGAGTREHFVNVVRESPCSAVAIASALHYGRLSVSGLRDSARQAGIPVRQPPELLEAS